MNIYHQRGGFKVKPKIPRPRPKQLPKVKSEYNIERLGINKYKITGKHEQVLDAEQIYMRFSNLLSEKSGLKGAKESNEKFMKMSDVDQLKKLSKLEGAIEQAKENNKQIDIQLNGLVREEAQIRNLIKEIKEDMGRKEKADNSTG